MWKCRLKAGDISEVLVSVVDEVKFDDETHRFRGDEDEIHLCTRKRKSEEVRK